MIKILKKKRIYLDYASGAFVSKRVSDVLKKGYNANYANSDAIHTPGVLAKRKIDEARKNIANCIGAHSDEIIFTSGGTESDNLAILGTLRKAKKEGKGNHVIISAVEHSAVFSLVDVLKREGFNVDIISVDSQGSLLISDLKEMLRPETVLVSVMMVGNETGIIYPVSLIAKTIRQYKKQKNDVNSIYPLLHTDAIQAFQTEKIKTDILGADLITLSSWKIYGPIGIGMLYVKRATPIEPIIWGGGQEGGLRSGTLSTTLILGLAEAMIETTEIRQKEKNRFLELRGFFVSLLKKEIQGVSITGEDLQTVPHIVHVQFKNVESETLLLYLDQAGISVSSKSACDSFDDSRSHAILAMNLEKDIGLIRFSFGRDTSKSDLSFVVKKIKKILALITS